MKPTDIGKQGEEAVCRYLTGRGYEILARNYRIRGAEVDIICSREDTLAFVEVKARRVGSMVDGFGAVTQSKQNRIIRAAYRYLQEQGIDESQWFIRYDIAAVNMWQGEVIDIDYLENAFDESGFSW